MNYQQSGRFTLGGVALGLAVGAAGALVFACAYGVGLIYIPEAHLAAFATMAFGALVGAAAGFGAVWGHIRNRIATLAVGAVSALLALYLSWAIWIPAVFLREGGKHISWWKLAQHPRAVWYLMTWINQYGTWSFDNSKDATKGWALWAVWAIEAALVVGIGIAVAVAVQRMQPYCETCGQWCRRAARAFLAPVADVQQLKLQLEGKDLRSLEGLGAGSKTGDHLNVELHSCGTCGQFHTLNVGQVIVRKKKFGHPQVNARKLVRQMIVGPGEAQTIRNLADKIAQMPKLAPDKTRGAAAGRS